MSPVLTTDVAVIGAGTAGSTAFREITRAGRTAVWIDHGPLGTTCARVGCMPSKAVLHAAHEWALLRELAGDSPMTAVSADSLWARARATRDALAAGAAQRTRTAAGDRLLMGTARFVAPGELDVDGRRVRARAFVIATGSRPVVPPSLAALGDRLLTTDTLFELERLPGSIGIVGLGAIGLEMGLALSRLGVRVVAGDQLDTVAGIVDPAVRERALRRFGRELPLWLGQPMQAQAVPAGVSVSSGERSETVDMVLAAVGRRPNVDKLDLQGGGVALDDRGQPRVDPATLRAGEAAVFLAGDVHPDRPLLHEAADEGVIAARGALALLDGRPPAAAERRARMSIVFSDPDVAAVGMAFDQLDLTTTVVGTAEGSGNGRSRILAATDNLVRIYAQRGSGTLLGASLMAARGEHLAHLLAWAVQRRESAASLLEMPYYHPTTEEMLQSALKDVASQLA
ncbi:dihydrolipoyl dehydrogenase [Ramlibacter sp.]|uniref:dihydrolipoyl dehydrogenase n=1 Tax=Ramlibacter sp. TaxID=1917967 RepID=UPI002CC6FEA2|nr:dihydrolipoyl dehydrogenase [Ramlibacter sp.]HWI83719.1 dihydrolipoyl dehydrogenase [Ramlibacter sp.]